MDDNKVRRQAYDLADQIYRDFEDNDSRELLWEVLAQVFRLDINLEGPNRLTTTAYSRIREEVETLFSKNQGPYHRQLLYEILEENIV